MLSGTKFDYVNELKSSLLELKTPINNDDVVRLVRTFWNHPDNIIAREKSITATEARAGILEKWLIPWCVPGAPPSMFDDAWRSLLTEAERDPQSFEAIKEIVLAWLEKDQIPLPVREAAKKIIRNEFKPNAKTAPKISPADYHKHLQIALAVWSVWHLEGYSLETSGIKLQNAFSVVSIATGYEYDTVREAWKKFKNNLPRKPD